MECVRAAADIAKNGGIGRFPFMRRKLLMADPDVITTITEEITYTDDGTVIETKTETEYPNEPELEIMPEPEPVIDEPVIIPEPVAPVAPVIVIVEPPANPEPVACAECAIKAERIAELEAQMETEEPITEGGDPLPAPETDPVNDKPPNSRKQRKGIAAWYYGSN